MGRNWISIPLGRTRIRLGRSVSDAELFGTAEKRLPSWVKYELREHLQKAAKARGETLTTEYCNYKIDKALALGEIDADGNLIVRGRGSNAEEAAKDIVAKYAAWEIDVPYEQALSTATECIRRIDKSNAYTRWTYCIIVLFMIAVFILMLLGSLSR
jgi:hypothetical protein